MNTTLLEKLLSIPTAPFREQKILKFLDDTLNKHNVPHFADPIGNIVVGAKDKRDYQGRLKRNPSPLFLFIAHTDHPGFQGEGWAGQRDLKVKWYGGSPNKHLKGAPVWVSSDSTPMLPGILSKVSLNKRGSAIANAVVRLDKNARKTLGDTSPQKLYGGFRFREPVWRKNKIFYTKAADDLVGSFAILTLALQKTRKNFLGLFTRAEEMGFIGTLEHLKLGWINNPRRKVICVSLETSRQLPGAIVGKGPIVRLGDRATVFDPRGIEHLTHLARKTLGKKFQRRIMDGGTCEGTAANAHGFPTMALSIPLGNYHNQSFEGGPDSRGPLGPAPEFVHLGDVAGMIRLCTALLDRPMTWDRVWDDKMKGFRDLLKTYGPLLRT